LRFQSDLRVSHFAEIGKERNGVFFPQASWVQALKGDHDA
jgi:hypothetical protein